MSYRSFKHVLGETHLERKTLVLFGICALSLTAASFWIYGNETEELVYKQNRDKGRLLVAAIQLMKHWEVFETNSSEEPNELIRQLSREMQEGDYEDYEWSAIRPFPTADGKGRPQDEHDYAVLEKFIKEPPPASETVEYAEREVPKNGEYHYYQAVRATSSCIFCHRATTGPPNLTEGDIISVVKVRISDESTQADINWNNAILWATAIVTAFLLVVASYVIIRYVIVKPLKHLQDVSDAVTRGDIQKRAEIHTGDEFEALGVAFNRMLRHLVDAQEELRHVNKNLDSKVDELAQLNMQLYEMNRLKGDFLATMSHELRTPLNSIIGFSDVLGSIDSLDEKQKRYVQNIQKSGKVLLDMINDILDLAKIESGKMEIRLTNFRIDHLIAAQCDMARPLTEKKNIDLDTYVEPGLPELLQDQGKVQQILNNLLSNAIKFTPEGGRIMVTARRSQRVGHLALIVSDTGVGIAEKDQTAIFEKFRQGEIVVPSGDAMTREYSGTGLGLSIVKELSIQLGGEVSVQSELGKGSEFTITIPWRLEVNHDGHPLPGLDESGIPPSRNFETYRRNRASSTAE